MKATDLNDYFYYVHVVEKGGFSAAAEALGYDRAATLAVQNLNGASQIAVVGSTQAVRKVCVEHFSARRPHSSDGSSAHGGGGGAGGSAWSVAPHVPHVDGQRMRTQF